MFSLHLCVCVSMCVNQTLSRRHHDSRALKPMVDYLPGIMYIYILERRSLPLSILVVSLEVLSHTQLSICTCQETYFWALKCQRSNDGWQNGFVEYMVPIPEVPLYCNFVSVVPWMLLKKVETFRLKVTEHGWGLAGWLATEALSWPCELGHPFNNFSTHIVVAWMLLENWCILLINR